MNVQKDLKIYNTYKFRLREMEKKVVCIWKLKH